MASASEGKSELSMLPDGTVLRFKYYRGKYEGVEFYTTVEDGRVEFQGETWSPSGAAREVDNLIRGEESNTWNGWNKWEWNRGDGEWESISTLTDG